MVQLSQTHERGDFRHVAKLSWPLIVGMLSFTIMDVTDTLMVGWLGTKPLAAVGLASTVAFFINSFFIGFFESVKILVAQATGAQHKDAFGTLGWQGIFLAIPSGLLVMTLGFFSSEIFQHLGDSIEVKQLASEYFSIRIFASPFWFIMIALGSYFQGAGNTQLPMRLNLLVCCLNILLCWILIFGLGPIPAMGVAGSALATVLSTLIGAIIILWIFIRTTQVKPKVELNKIRKLMALGFPVGVRWLLDVGGWTVAVGMMASLGEIPLAANQIATKIMHITILPVYGISESTAILTGQCVGANDIRAVYRSYWSALKLSQIIMIIFGAIFFLFPGWIIAYFHPEPAVLALASEILMMIAVFQIFAAISMTTAGALNGTGDTKFTMFLSVTATWFIMVPLAYLFGFYFNFGTTGMWAAVLLQEITLSMGAIWRFWNGAWLNRQSYNIVH